MKAGRKNLTVSATAMSLFLATQSAWATDSDMSSLNLKPPIPQAQPAQPPEVVPKSISQDVTTIPMTNLKKVIKESKSGPLTHELSTQFKPQNIGASPVTDVVPDGPNVHIPNSNEPIALAHPPLQALISVDQNLNSYGMEAKYSQEVGLRDVLLATVDGNLNVLRSASMVQSQKWKLRNAYTGYLPGLTTGFNEIGLNSISQLPIQALARSTVSGTTVTATAQTLETVIRTHLSVLQGGFNWKPVQGGKLIFTLLAQKNQLNANKAQLRADISDALLSCTKNYNKLLLDDVTLQIRTASVATSVEQLREDMSQKKNGLATNLDVLQARTQLAKDRQDLITQQNTRRQSAIELAYLLNANLFQDLTPRETVLAKAKLIPKNASLPSLISIAIDNRPELKQYEQLRKMAKANIGVAVSDLLPSASLGGSVIGIQSSIGSMQPTYLLNFGVNWRFDGLGLAGATDIQQSRWKARQAMLEANQKLAEILKQVHESYNQCFTTESAIEETNSAVQSSAEALRLARLRLKTGFGTNLDVITAQRDYTKAQIDKAEAIINYNNAQAQLVHDIGLTSVDHLSGKAPIVVPGTQ